MGYFTVTKAVKGNHKINSLKAVTEAFDWGLSLGLYTGIDTGAFHLDHWATRAFHLSFTLKLLNRSYPCQPVSGWGNARSTKAGQRLGAVGALGTSLGKSWTGGRDFTGTSGSLSLH